MLADTDRAFQRRVPGLLAGLAALPDFEIQMRWEFSSWLPLVSRILPNDDIVIYKRGSSIRMDSTLLGLAGLSWERGHISNLILGMCTLVLSCCCCCSQIDPWQ